MSALFKMQKNVGTTDRIIRVVVGVVILALGIVYSSWWGLLGLIPVFTAITARCGLYVPFGINTCKVPQTAAEAATWRAMTE